MRYPFVQPSVRSHVNSPLEAEATKVFDPAIHGIKPPHGMPNTHPGSLLRFCAEPEAAFLVRANVSGYNPQGETSEIR